MNAFNALGLAAILALAAGCQATRSTSSSRPLSWAAHEEISRTYSTGCPLIPDTQASQRDGQDLPVASGMCNGTDRDSVCVHCGR